MAVATGQESKEVVVKRYVGIAALKFVALNPTREELNNILGQDFTNEEIKYIDETTVKDKDQKDVNVPRVRLSFVMKTDPQIACNNGIDTHFIVNYFMSKNAVYSFKEGVKLQVIDAYGRTAWATPEQLKEQVVPEFIVKNGPRKGQSMKTSLSVPFRAAYQGEENLVKFIKAFLVIPRPDAWNNDTKTYVMKTNAKELEKSECQLEEIKKYFEGNLSEIVKIIKFQPNNTVKMLVGVRTAQNGAQYQDFYVQHPLTLSTTDYKGLEDKLNEDKAAGRHPSTEYRVVNLSEFTVKASDYSKEPEKTADDPFAATTASDPFVGQEATATEMPIDTDPFAM